MIDWLFYEGMGGVERAQEVGLVASIKPPEDVVKIDVAFWLALLRTDRRRPASLRCEKADITN